MHTNNATTCDYTLSEMLAAMKRAMQAMPSPPSPLVCGFDGRFGYELRPNIYMADRKQVHFPRSKKKRMRRKWAKQPKNYRDVPKPDVYLIDGRYLVGHPATLAKIEKKTTNSPSGRE